MRDSVYKLATLAGGSRPSNVSVLLFAVSMILCPLHDSSILNWQMIGEILFFKFMALDES